MNDVFGDLDPAALRAERERLGAVLGEPLSVVAITGSTNDDARKAAGSGAPHGATFFADAQTAGRGRGGHTWHSPRGENLYFSVVLRPARSASAVATLPLVAGLAVVDALEPRLPGARPALGLKWPNDVLCGGRKLAGILVESQLRGSAVAAAIVGIGINVRATRFPDELAVRATSLALLGCADLDRSTLAAAVLARLGEHGARWDAEGLGPFLERLRARDALRGATVSVTTSGGVLDGIAEGVDDGGRLLVRDAAGSLHAITSGSVALRDPSSPA